MQIRGVIGQLRWGYYTAAAIHGYTVEFDKKTQTGSLVGTVVESNPFRLSQRPLEFVAPPLFGRGSDHWIVESHEILNGTVLATLTRTKEAP